MRKVREVKRIPCQADPACPFPGPLCAQHQRMQGDPLPYSGKSLTARMSESLEIRFGTGGGRATLPSRQERN